MNATKRCPEATFTGAIVQSQTLDESSKRSSFDGTVHIENDIVVRILDREIRRILFHHGFELRGIQDLGYFFFA